MSKVRDAVVKLFRRREQTPEEQLRGMLDKMTEKGLDERGRIVVDSTPMSPPIGYKPQPSMVDIVREMVRSERLRQEALSLGLETFEEADDFAVDDEPEQLRSIHENDDFPSLQQLAREVGEDKAGREYRRKMRFEYWRDRQDFAKQNPADASSTSSGSPSPAASAGGSPESSKAPE